ncbi:MAG: hypothetical protein ACK5CA_04720 [Cyanobacteriota bacterium]|jgi:hypothetical protein
MLLFSIPWPNPLTETLEPLQPALESLGRILSFTLHHPLLSLLLALLTLFLLTGLVQVLMELSRKFWDYLLFSSALVVKWLLKSLWRLLMGLVRRWSPKA